MGSPDVTIIVPARLESQRFPRKLLHPIRGRPFILWTAERIRSEAPEFPLVFAVGEGELEGVLREAGFRVVATDPGLRSGTDRIAAASREIGARRVINVQADEPLVHGEQIRALAGLLGDGAAMGTLATPFREARDFLDPNQVKVVVDAAGFALYFSRSPIPYDRDRSGVPRDGDLARFGPLRHLGLYAYEEGFLETFAALPQTTAERTERLEQLRALGHGHRIRVGVTERPTIGVDTLEDARRFSVLAG